MTSKPTAADRYVQARRIVLNTLPKNGKGAEIGVWTGDFSARILKTARPGTLHLIDPWQAATDATHGKALYSAARGVDMDGVHASVCARFAEAIAAGQVVIHRATSVEAMAGIADDSLDFVYIDGDHAYDAVRTDLDLAWAKCRPGGLIAVDDYSTGKWWGDDVIRATNEFVGTCGAKVAIAFAMAGQVVLRKRQAHRTTPP